MKAERGLSEAPGAKGKANCSAQRAWKRALLPAAAGGRLVAPAETGPDGRQTHAGSSSAERTTDPYINLEFNAKFQKLVLFSS